ncbi:aryl-alcohol dehydrogenase-like predicted oxidoreductase [Alteromonadaceae bacterium 2753L.S.0a.02]|nr:aryl-alcohol dehydrogenase-like predicted oxidoreductase [Alteromonadaceae bacterium 2753L.S.0a.02]
MKTVKLGSQGLEVSAMGLGCMGMSEFYGGKRPEEVDATLLAAVEQGLTFWDSAEIYGPFTNEQLLGDRIKALNIDRNKLTIATKFGVMRNTNGEWLGNDSSPQQIRKSCEGSLKRLQIETIDLYYQHRPDPNVPVEEVVGTLKDLIQEGKVRYIGLSESDADTIRRAHAVHPLSALQGEYSLWSRDLESSELPVLKELGIGLVAYSPLGRGFLTGAIKSRADLDADDWRLTNPRFSEANFAKNLTLVTEIEAIAKMKGCTPAQIGLAWITSQGYVPIPGTRKASRLIENSGALDVTLTDDDIRRIDEAFPLGSGAGERY